jgi:glycosyltransferase involved in cell wall biosynthesis
MRMLQICAVDFTAYHLLGPLLRASRDDGWTVEFACADGPFAARLRAEGFAHRRIPMTRAASPRRQALATLALARSLRADAPDLVHTHTPAGGLVGRAAAGLAFRGPVLHTFHGLPFPGRPSGLVERAFLGAERLLSRRTTYFFSQARGDVDRAVDLGIARRADTLVIGNGVDVRRFAPDEAERARVRAELGIPADAIVVLMVARLVREKGVLELADAALRLRDDPRIHVLLAGEPLPSDRTGVDRELAEHPVNAALGSRWRRLGHRADVDALLKASDIFTLPSYREGLPRSVIEAMAAGVPVVATDIPACRELVIEGETGLLVPVRDAAALAGAIARLAADAGVRRRMGERGRETAATEHDERLVLGRQLETFRRFVPR